MDLSDINKNSHYYELNALKSTDSVNSAVSRASRTSKSSHKSYYREKPVSLGRALKIFGRKGFRLVEKYTDSDRRSYLLFLIRHNLEGVELMIDVKKYNFIASKDEYPDYVLYEYLDNDGELEQNLINQDIDVIRQVYNEIEHNGSTSLDEKEIYADYQKDISLKGREEHHKSNLSAIKRQHKRFSMTVRNLPYQIAILQDHWLVLNDKHNQIYSYYVKGNVSNRVCLLADLEYFFTQEGIKDDILSVFSQFYKILDENQVVLAKKVQKLINSRLDIIEKSNAQERKKAYWVNQIKGQKSKLDDLLNKEKHIYKELDKLATKGDPNSDDFVNQKVKFQEDLDEIAKERTILLDEIITNRNKLNNIVLTTDKVLFEILLLLIHTHKFVDALKVSEND